MSENIYIKINEIDRLAARYDRPAQNTTTDLDRKLVILIHGFPGHKSAHNDLYADLQFVLSDKGFHTLRFDFYGCGESSGETKDFTLHRARTCLDAIRAWAKDEGYYEFSYISEGLGSIVAMMGMGTKLKSQVMMWPALDPQHIAKSVFRGDAITDEEHAVGYLVEDENRIGVPFINELAKLNIKPFFQDVTMPVLILHGSADDRYPVEHLDIARKNMTSKRIEITTFHDGEHGLPELNHRKSMFYHIAQFLEKFG